MQRPRREIALSMLGFAAGAMAPPGVRCADTSAIHHPLTEAESRAAVTPVNYACMPGAFRRYGADPSGAKDSTAAINAALKCNVTAFDDWNGPGVYKVEGLLRFSAGGQKLVGQNSGNKEGSAGTTLKYAGKAGGTVVSVSNTSINFSECVVRDLLIDGSLLAGRGIEAYDDAAPGGSWRVKVENVSIIGVTGGKAATAIYLGIRGAPNFANDIFISGCFIAGCTRGLWGTGSWHQIIGTTFSGCSDAAIYAGDDTNSSSSAWTINDCVFSSNSRDFNGFHISQASFSGCWFENSSAAIYKASGAHSVSFTGCYLHTFNPGSMMDFGNAAGYHFFGGNFLPSGTRSAKIINVNPTALGAVLGQPMVLLHSNGTQAPAIMSASAIAPRFTSANLSPGESTSLALTSGIHNISLSVRDTANHKSRTQARYVAFLHEGDGNKVVEIASNHGGDGGESCSIRCAGNQVIVVYTGRHEVLVELSSSA